MGGVFAVCFLFSAAFAWSQAVPNLAMESLVDDGAPNFSTQLSLAHFDLEASSWNGCFAHENERVTPLAEPPRDEERTGLPKSIRIPGPRTLSRPREDDRLVRPFADRSRSCTVIEDSCQRSTPTPVVWILETLTKICQLEEGLGHPGFPPPEPLFGFRVWPPDRGEPRAGFQLDLDRPPELA